MLRLLYTIYAAVVFLVIMLLIFPLCILAAFLGRIRGGNMIYMLCTAWADLWFALAGIRVQKTFTAPFDKEKKYILIANHISYLDIPVMVKVFRKPMRALGKVEMGAIPVFGFIYKRAIVTVDRKSAAGRAKSIRILRSVINKGISIFVFPEGTFNETGRPLKDFYNGAFKLALETGTPVRPVLFLDTYDRMPYTKRLSLNPGRCRVVFLDEVPVDGLGPKDHEQLKQKVFALMEQKLVEYNVSWIRQEPQ
ncbi:lysophospholipid acyltransferase family protein [Niabella drilacis]|uniref:1-acyl-sn-glycerol-3-phosphate acyltransferase n=1 Tax=Niabella drilacis (strain DSM 25811 / CCM 8410 / CCUG 62505 / LMG 26954 / E90) TaxID=1285928 RepID=A0A1G6LMX4_NIADE|nr:lysophospholipid acyltransferase family protein [Niabella drilacis]SDC44573.1 1-acyl-sn-glycerol-3-phosphate acyltransferase [Niabella drilacis]